MGALENNFGKTRYLGFLSKNKGGGAKGKKVVIIYRLEERWEKKESKDTRILQRASNNKFEFQLSLCI